jgi:fucose permease
MESSPLPAPGVPSSEVSFRPAAFAGATTVFILLGATSSMYGPLLLSFSHRFHLSLPSAGAVISVSYVGSFFGVLLGWLGVKRLSGSWVLSGALWLMAIGATGAALSHHWPAFLVCVFGIGVGFGALDFSLNTLLTRTALKGRVFRLSVGNAGFGVGAVIGPLIIIALHPHNFPVLLAGIAVGALLLSTLTRGVHAPRLRGQPDQLEVSALKSQRRPILITFTAAYILYIAVESSSSGWIAAHLHGSGYSGSTANFVTTGFWAGMALGRVLTTPLHHRTSDKTLVLGGLGLAVVVSCCAFSGLLAPYAYPVLGLALASIFPMGLIWYTVLCPHDSDGLALMILFMMAGGVIGPGAESLMVSAFSVHVVPLVIASFALADLAVFASALRFKPLFSR